MVGACAQAKRAPGVAACAGAKRGSARISRHFSRISRSGGGLDAPRRRAYAGTVIRIYQAGTAAEANLLADELRQHGIATHVNNAEVQVMLGNIASSQPEVWLVQDTDLPRASVLVHEFATTNRQGSDKLRVCPTCKEENPANFELCWKCRQPLAPRA
jgi:hypothetical protein